MAATGGFVPPPYPHDRLAGIAGARRGGARRDRRRVGRHAGRPDAGGGGAGACRRRPRRDRLSRHDRHRALPRSGSWMDRATVRVRDRARRRRRVHRHEGAGGVAATGAVAARPQPRRRALPVGLVSHLRDGRDPRRAASGPGARRRAVADLLGPRRPGRRRACAAALAQRPEQPDGRRVVAVGDARRGRAGPAHAG